MPFQVSPELLQRFFNKQCTAEEAEKIVVYLKANPAILENYLSLQEWNMIEEPKTMPEEFWSEVWQNVQKKNKAKIVSLWVRRTAAAAGVILLLGVIYSSFDSVKNYTEPSANVIVKALPPPFQPKSVFNTTKKSMNIVLEDSSVVELSSASSIKYDTPFSNNKRNVFLEGEAKFRVAKNKQKPFTVYTGVIATTALGTVFSVKKLYQKNSITVKLFQGTVVIHPAEKNLKGWKNDVYLTPGQQMQFDPELMTVAVNKINRTKPNTGNRTEPKKDSVNDHLIFNNTPLSAVMHKLSASYHITILYDPADIHLMNFTGVVSKKDSLYIILKAIAEMNNLTIQQTNDQFIISKNEDK